MRVCIITTSRADFGIYESLLREFDRAEDVEFGLLVSGTHLSEKHGYTIAEIEESKYPIWATVPVLPGGDSPLDISFATGKSLSAFSKAFNKLQAGLDFVIALGDRYEMFAAVAATVPFNLQVAHLHGGETTAGAIDEKYRHAITAMSTIHFTATTAYGERVKRIIGGSENVFVVGSISLDGLSDLDLPSADTLKDRFGVDFSRPTILVTMHPETVAYKDNELYASTLCNALEILSQRYQIVITLPNADTKADVIRNQFMELGSRNEQVFLIESFGKINYFAAMKYSKMLIGNTSSGILEAPSLGRFAINLGTRQGGRARSANVIDVTYNAEEILQAVAKIERLDYEYRGGNVYVKYADPAKRILKLLQEKLAQSTKIF